MTTISIEPTAETKTLISRLKNSSKIVNEAKRKGLIFACNIFTSFSKEKSPIATGNLRRSIKATVENDGSQAKVFTDVDYSIHQEYGTGIYGINHRMITPKRARFLRFTIGGKVIFARKVKGTPGKHFMSGGATRTQDRTADISEVILKELKNGLQS